MERIDIHGYARRLELARESLDNPVSERNQTLIHRFAKHCTTLGLSKPRVAKYYMHLKRLARWLGKDFSKTTKLDLEHLVYRIESSDYSPWTKQNDKVVLKRFYKWLKGKDEEYPPEIKWIKTTFSDKDKPLPSELPTEEEIKRLVEVADNPRDRAFIMVLYETGGRIGEIGSLRIKDVEFMKDYASVILKGKTGSRRVPIVAAVPYLSMWIEHHSGRSKPNAPLWPKFSDGKPMTYPALAKVLKVAAERAGLAKCVSPSSAKACSCDFPRNQAHRSPNESTFRVEAGERYAFDLRASEWKRFGRCNFRAVWF